MNTLKSTALTATCITILASGAATAAPPQYQCYDFNDLASDASYTVGDVIDTRHAAITIKPYFNNGNR